MIKLKFSAIAVGALLALGGCAEDKSNTEGTEVAAVEKKSGPTIISGNIENAGGLTLQISEASGGHGLKLVSSAIVEQNGDYRIEVNISNTGFYRLGFNEKNFTVLVLEPGKEITVNANSDNMFQSYSVENSNESDLLRQFNMLTMPLDSVGQVAQYHYQQGNQQGYIQAMVAQQQIQPKVTQGIKDFIDANPGTMVAIAAVLRLGPDASFDYLEKVKNAASETYSDNQFYKQLADVVQKQAALKIGAPAPEIALNNPQGQPVALSSLRGKVVLIDFWASWCKPCRAENPNVVKVYNKYKDQGFEIYGVSLDKTKDQWMAAIQQDGLPWVHVSDLQFWNSSVVPLYDVQGIPKTVLLDAQGNILAKDLRGTALELKLAEIFGEA